MLFQYDRAHRRLWVNCPHVGLDELQSLVRQAYREELFPERLDAILYETPDATFILRGSHLRRWLAGEAFIRLSQNVACFCVWRQGRELDL
jgi:hypothetical protein